jgi:diguanylate cyclase (GGDEF)-like protein
MGWVEETAETLRAAVPDPTTRLLDAVVELTSVEGGLAEIAPVLAELACAVSNADGASVSRVDGAEIVFLAGTGLHAGIEGNRTSRDGSLAGVVVATAEPQVCLDTHNDSRVDRAACDRLGVRSLAVVPIRQSHHTHALFILCSDRPGGVDQAMVEFLNPLFRVASIRLAQSSAAASQSLQLERLRDVTQSSRELLLADDPGQFLVDEVARIADAAHVYLMLPQDAGSLVITRCHGESMLGTVTPADSTSYSGQAFATGRPKVVGDWTTRPGVLSHVVDNLTSVSGGRASSAACIPLVSSEGVVGVVTALMREPITASNADLLGVLQLLAAEAGTAITRDALRRKLADQARTDPLTGLANRRVWNERLDQEMERARRTGEPLAVAVLDLDYFKRFNDSFGHPAGDELLRQVAHAWAAALRPTDLLARLGGEEFGVLLPEADVGAATAILDRLRAVVPLGQSVSIGLVIAREEERDQTMQRADDALYGAKATGRDRIVTG